MNQEEFKELLVNVFYQSHNKIQTDQCNKSYSLNLKEFKIFKN
jgi:hypothetical protein